MTRRKTASLAAGTAAAMGLIAAVSLGSRRAAPAADLGALYLVPDRFQATQGEHLAIGLRSRAQGSGAEHPAEWQSIAPEWFFVRVAATQENRESDFFPAGQQPIDYPLEHAGVMMIGLQTNPRVQSVPADAFVSLARATLSNQEADEVIEAMPAGRDVRIKRIDAAKAIASARPSGPSTPESSAAITESGQRLEIFLMADPTAILPGSDIPVTVASGGGDEAADIRVFAQCLDGTPAQEAVTNESGIAFIHITKPGIWRVEFRHAEPLVNDPAADIVLYTGTATFSIAPKTR